MSKRSLCLLLTLAASGCFVPKNTETTTVLRTRVARPVAIGPGMRQLVVSSAGPIVNVVARVERQCSKRVYETVQIRHSKELDLDVGGGGGIGGGDPRAVIVVAAVAIFVVMPVSLAVSGLVVLASKDTVETTERLARTQTVACPLIYRDLKLRAALPSGAEIELTTNSHGAAHLEVPATEPGYGIVRVSSSTLTASTRYYRDQQGCEAHRNDILAAARASTSASEHAARWAELPRCGSSSAERATDAAWQATSRAARIAGAGDCNVALTLEAEVFRADPAVHANVFLQDVALAACVHNRDLATQTRERDARTAAVTREADARTAAATRAACLEARRGLMLRAQQIQDPSARGKALSVLPTCAPAAP
jgi:hypothetical protein